MSRNRIERKWFKQIEDIKPKQKVHAGDLAIDSILYHNCILLILDGKSTLFCPETFDEDKRNEIWRELIGLTNRLIQLKNDNIVFLSYNATQNFQWAFGKDCKQFDRISTESYKLGEGIIYNRSNNTYIEYNGTRLTASEIDGELSRHLAEILKDFVYPTHNFKDYMKCGFLTNDEYGLKLARKSIKWATGACLLSVLVCAFSVYAANKLITTTIEPTQVDRIVSAIDSCKTEIGKSTTQDSTCLKQLYEINATVKSTQKSREENVSGKKQK